VNPAARAAGLHFRDYEAADRAAVIALLSEGRAPSYRRMKSAIFDWQFTANPHDDGRTPFIVGTLDGEIVAVNGLMPVAIRYQDKALRACWSCDTYVAASLRGCGVGKKLIARATARAQVMLGYGISDMSDPLLERQGWSLHPATWSLFFHSHEPGLTGKLKDLCSRAKRIHGMAHPLPRLEVMRHDEDFGPDVDELWHRCASSYFSTIRRDAAYLNWKYRQHPFETYVWYAAREGGRLRGLLVARHSEQTSVLVDYCGGADDVELMTGLVAQATADLIAGGTTRILCEGTHAPLRGALERAGYVGARSRPRFRVYADVAPVQPPLERWFLMPGDSDGDMMNDAAAAMAFRWPSSVTAYVAPVS
jgi:GNAT superfamily N-acetyltransferase